MQNAPDYTLPDDQEATFVFADGDMLDLRLVRDERPLCSCGMRYRCPSSWKSCPEQFDREDAAAEAV